MQGQRIGGHAGLQRDVHLAAAGDVEQHALLVRQPSHRPAQERLGGVHGALVTERVDRLATAAAQVHLVVDEQRRAVGRRQVGAPTDHRSSSEPSSATAAVSGSRWRGSEVMSSDYIRSGASMPSIDNPCARTRAVRSASANRLSRSSSVGAFSTGQAS